jgi:5'-deoxynucleotidase
VNIFQHFLDRSLAHIVRFNSHPQHFNESVAEHSFYVAYFTSVLSYFLRKINEPIDEAKAIKIALVHDMEETFSGDILTPFKHHNDKILKAIHEINEEIIPLVFENLPDELSKEFVALWKEDSNQETKEAQVVKLADKLSLIAKCHEEMKAGNEFFKPIYDKELAKLQKLEYPWWRKIKNDIIG